MKRLFIIILYIFPVLYYSHLFAVEKEVEIISDLDGAVLAGTFSTPSTHPKALVVLATGSGQQDRDETFLGMKPFKVLSDSLSSAGYAVLRMDDRGVGGSEGYTDDYTTTTYVSDIHTALQWVGQQYPGVPKGVIGHSNGGTVAIRLAANDTVCDFIVTLAGPAWSGDSIVMSQSRAVSYALTGKWDGEEIERQFLSVVKSDLSSLQAYPMLMSIFTLRLGDTLKFPGVQEQLALQLKTAMSPWYREFVRYNPENDIRGISIPWLALNGDRDFQVLVGNLDTIRSLNPDATAITMKDHNHMFQQTHTGLITDYEKDGPSFSGQTIATVINWLDNITPSHRESDTSHAAY